MDSPLGETNAESSEGPWLVLCYRTNPSIRVDFRLVDRVLATDQQLHIVVGPLRVELTMLSDAEACARLATELAPYTRSAPITRREAYIDAKRRLDFARRNCRDDGAHSIFIGALGLSVKDDQVLLGDAFVCPLLDLALAAQDGVPVILRHPHGAYPIQAALAILVVAAQDRPVEDAAELSERIAEYERQHGRD